MHIIAHRGYSSDRPENTIASFDLAIEKGFENIELDIHMTKDGVPVVMHDGDVSRTTDSSGLISEMTFEQIKLLDAGSWFKDRHGYPFPRQEVPSLEEILSRYASNAHIFIEIKSGEKEILYATKEILEHFELTGDGEEYDDLDVPGVSIISFDPDQMIRSKALFPDIKHGFLTTKFDYQEVSFCLSNGIEGLFPYIHSVDSGVVENIHRDGLFVGVWGLTKADEVGLAIESGVDGITVDWPQIAKDYIDFLPN